jgi:hypothetical protein
MLEKLLEILGNSHFEAWVVGGVTGAIYGQLFGVFGKRKDQTSPRQQSVESPQEIQQKMREQRQQPSVREVHHHHYHHGKRTSGNDDAMPVFVFAGIALLVSLLFFAAYLPQIADTLYFFVTTIAVFSVAAGVSAALGGRFNTTEWWLHTIAPAVTAMGCFWVMTIAYAAISPDVVSYAQKLIANKPLSFATVLGSAITFFRALGNEYVRWMLFDMLAFIAVLVSSVICAAQCVYYIALMNFRDSGGKGWRIVVNVTASLSGFGPLLLAWVLLLLAWFLASGWAYRLTL